MTFKLDNYVIVLYNNFQTGKFDIRNFS